MQKTLLFHLGLWLAGIWIGSVPVNAQTRDPGERALEAITSTTLRICTVIDSAGGSVESTRVTGEAKAQINGLLRRLAELGITGQGEFSAEAYVGVLRSDLAPLFHDMLQCRRDVFNDLTNRLLPPSLRSGSGTGSRIEGGRAPGNPVQPGPAVIGSYTGQIENTANGRSGNLSMEIRQDTYGRDLAITVRLWGRMRGTGILRAQIGPAGDLRASGSLKAGSAVFLMNMAGRVTDSDITGGFQLVPSGETRVDESEGEFRVRKFIPLVGSVQAR